VFFSDKKESYLVRDKIERSLGVTHDSNPVSGIKKGVLDRTRKQNEIVDCRAKISS
jgi:hypothetical protein